MSLHDPDADAAIVLTTLGRLPRDTVMDGSQLAAAAGLDSERLQDAMDVLVTEGLITFDSVFAGEFSFTNAHLTREGRVAALRLIRKRAQEDSNTMSSSTEASDSSAVRVFISHSSRDKSLVDESHPYFAPPY